MRPWSNRLSNRLYSTLPRLFAIAPPKAGAANVPRMERARRPPKAGNRAHIPRAIASREAMLWQGCRLPPSELERKPPRSVWATPLPASRPTRWIVRESREAHRADTAAPRPWGRMCLGQLGDDLRTTPHGRGWKSICLAF